MLCQSKTPVRSPLTLNAVLALRIVMQDAKVSNSVRASLMTLHKSKGLEFDHVFICGGEENLLPSPQALDEVNLFYVGAKGATKTLSVTWCRKRLDPSQSRQSMIRSRLGRSRGSDTRSMQGAFHSSLDSMSAPFFENVSRPLLSMLIPAFLYHLM